MTRAAWLLALLLVACAGPEVHVAGVTPSPDPWALPGPVLDVAALGSWIEADAPAVPGWDDRAHAAALAEVLGDGPGGCAYVGRDGPGPLRLHGPRLRVETAAGFLAQRVHYAGAPLAIDGVRLPFADAGRLRLAGSWPVIGGRAVVVPRARVRELVDRPEVREHVRRRFDHLFAPTADGVEAASVVAAARWPGGPLTTTRRTAATPYLLADDVALLVWRHEVEPTADVGLELAGGERVAGEVRLVTHGRAVVRRDQVLVVVLPHPREEGFAQLVVLGWDHQDPVAQEAPRARR